MIFLVCLVLGLCPAIGVLYLAWVRGRHQKRLGLEPPKALDAIADVVLAYRPKPKSKPAKKRKRRASKIAKAAQK